MITSVSVSEICIPNPRKILWDIDPLFSNSNVIGLRQNNIPFRDNISQKQYFLSMDFELQPYIQCELLKLRPLSRDDFSALYEVASDPLVWEQHPHKERYQREVFEHFFDNALESKGALIVSRNDTNQIIGSSRFYDFNPSKSQIAIGYTFLSRACWGHKYNKEMKRLMLDHAFKFVDSVVFHIGDTNIRSQKAIEKIGATLVERFPRTLPDGSPYMEMIFQVIKKNISN
jgi:RimJ/RimL family protein N-acetyltransferase